MTDYLFEFEKETLSPDATVLLADHFIESHGYFGHRPNGTKDWLMIMTVSGEGQFRVNKQVLRCGAGDVALLPPGIPHHYATPEGSNWELMWVHFLPLPDWQSWLQLPRTDEGLILIPVGGGDQRARMKDAFNRLIHDSRQTSKSSRQLALIALSEILVLLHQEAVKTEDEIIDERVERIIRHLAEHLQTPHSLQDLAALAGLSVSRMCHLFKEQTGETITAKLNKMRLDKASRMLEITSRKIQDIALEVGFESPYYFTTKFTRQFGTNPTEFRKRAQKKWQFS